MIIDGKAAMKRFTPQYKKKVILEILVKGKTFKEVAAKYKCSRQAIYGWILLYKKAPKKTSSLKNHYRRGRNHPKKVSWKIEKQILDIVVKKPDLGISGINKELAGLGYTISRHGIYNILLSYQLQTKEFRHRFSLNHPVKTVFAHNLVSTQRARVVEEYLHQDKKISQICTIWKISRPTFYSWLKRYNEAVAANGGLIDALSRNYKRGEFHHRATGKEIVGKILEIVQENPSYSAHKIFENLPRIDGKPVVGHHGIQNILFRENLNTASKRLAYAAGYVDVPGVSVAPLYVPEMPLYRLRQLISPFTTIPKLLVTNPKVGAVKFGLLSLPFLLFVFWVRMLVLAPLGSSKIGLIFASISLVFGIFFFIYSMKYYISILIVLRLAQGGGSGRKGISHKFLTGIAKFFGIDTSKVSDSYTNPLSVNLDKVSLSRQPFVSIHAAIYNEKRVVERLIEACQNQEWAHSAGSGQANYEVIIADDSTDETTEIAKQFLREKYGGLRFSKDDLGTEIYKADATDNLPSFTLIHRNSRDGFKGAALQKALENTNPKAEYISVFDSDFVPFPDTISQFVKMFQESCGGLDNVKDSNIAAVQGYQWHVLNKSQNWVTRGVRSEYAGSYVIERAGEEIYGGLKQIAGSVYAIRTDVLRKFGWGTSITEDFELTLRLYEAGYKVAFTPYIQAPAEAVSTLRRLIRQRMRWAEGASFNIKVMFSRMLNSKKMTPVEKMEFAYLSPYYLQAAFFVIGTFCWFLSEAVFGARLPFWTAAFGWSLVFTNLFALPLMNIIGLFLEESSERDYVGIFSFVALSYIVVPFQAFAAIKGFLEAEEGPWFRTPKTGTISDDFGRPGFSKFFGNLFGRPIEAGIEAKSVLSNDPVSLGSVRAAGNLAFSGAFNVLNAGGLRIRPRNIKWVGNFAFSAIIAITVGMSILAPFVPVSNSYASESAIKTVDKTAASEPKVGEADPAWDPKSPSNKKEIINNVLSEEITKSRLISRKSAGGKTVEFVFDQLPNVRIKSDHREIEFETVSIGGKKVMPKEARIYEDKKVVYEDVVSGIDLVYEIGDEMVSEQFVVKNRAAVKTLGEKIEQRVQLVDVKVIAPGDGEQFGFFDRSGKAVFEVSDPFAKDDDGRVFEDIKMTLDKDYIGYRLTKHLNDSFKNWILDPVRAFPVVVDPSVIVSGTIVNADVAHGNFQRKVHYMPNASGGAAWYAFFADPDASYKKCLVSTNCDATGDWTGPVDIDTTDADNINPAIGVSGDMIMIIWVDDSLEKVEAKRLVTTTDTLGTLCTPSQASPGAMDSSTIVSVAALSTTTALMAFADDATANVVDVYYATTLDGTCVTTDVHPGNLPFFTFGAGVTIDDRPILLPLTSTTAAMVFQDGTDLSMAVFDTALSEWTQNNTTLGSVTSTVFSAATDGTTVWAITVNSGTTSFVACCTASTGMVETAGGGIDTDVGAAGDNTDNDVDIFCPSATTCQIVYIDGQDETTPSLNIVACTNADCSSVAAGTPREIDTDIGSATEHDSNPSIFCVTDANNCKIAYGENLDTTTPDFAFIDCNDADCDTPSASTPNTDVGEGTAPKLRTDIYCIADADCQVVYLDNDASSGSLVLADCSAANCSTRDTMSNIQTNINNNQTAEYNLRMSIWCVASGDCRILYQDGTNSDLSYLDCAAAACSGVTPQDIDTNAGGTGVSVPNQIDCTADGTNCQMIYSDALDTALFYVDCDAAACSTALITTIDDVAGNTIIEQVSLDCPSLIDCKGTWAGVSTSGSERLYFFDCDSAVGVCRTGNAVKLPTGAETRGAVNCPATNDCKLAYFDDEGDATPPLRFADCTNESCLPEASDPADPWSGLTNLTSVSISYDSANSDLYAHAVYGTDAGTEQAYWKMSDATTISWGTENSYGFTAGDLAELSSPLSGAGTAQIGVVARQGSNFEFAPIPEKSLLLVGALPFLPRLLKKLKRKRRVLRC